MHPVSSLPPRTRLFVQAPLAEHASISCEEKRAHYLLHVLRLREGEQVVLFNGTDGEWLATLEDARKKSVSLVASTPLRPQKHSPDLWLLCTPLKNGRTDWVVEKATELGISSLCPVTTRFTSVDRTNSQRLQAIAVEAAEQSERMDVPTVAAIAPLPHYLSDWPEDRTLFYADETGMGMPPQQLVTPLPHSKYAVLVGPEGGFSREELAQLRRLPYAKALTLGPRILRADTAAVAAITLIQSILGDWEEKPAFRNEEDH